MALNQEGYSELIRTSKMELFPKKVHGFHLLIVFAKSAVLDVWLDFKYSSGTVNHFRNFNWVIKSDLSSVLRK